MLQTWRLVLAAFTRCGFQRLLHAAAHGSLLSFPLMLQIKSFTKPPALVQVRWLWWIASLWNSCQQWSQCRLSALLMSQHTLF